MSDRVLVVGAGLVGSLVALYLADRGHQVEIVERHGDPRNRFVTAGRSINLTLCERGFVALDRLGLGEEVRAITVPCYGRVMHGRDGALEAQPYGSRREAIYSVSRRELNRLLLSFALARPNVHCRFEQICLEVDLDRPAVLSKDLASGTAVWLEADRLIGTDGAYSRVRAALQNHRGHRFDLDLEHLDQAYKELRAPADAVRAAGLDLNALHIWPRGHYMLIAFPNLDGSLTVALHLPYLGNPSHASIRTAADLEALFERDFPDALALLPNLEQEFFANPEASMVTVRCRPWRYLDRALVLGDAAHAIVPSYGQGANCGFEDCSVLADCLDQEPTWAEAFEAFEEARKPNADAIAQLALEHFQELRELVGDPDFLLRKEIERELNAAAPERFASLYHLVSFTTTPYSEARRRDAEQRGVVDRIVTRVAGVPREARSGAIVAAVRQVLAWEPQVSFEMDSLDRRRHSAVPATLGKVEAHHD